VRIINFVNDYGIDGLLVFVALIAGVSAAFAVAERLSK
jgi:hypothetical protein